MKRAILAAPVVLLCGGLLMKATSSTDKPQEPEVSDTSETEDSLVTGVKSQPKSKEASTSELDKARKEVLSRLPACQSEFQDYWDVSADPKSTSVLKKDALAVYEGCATKNDLAEDPSVETAWDVYSSIQSYTDFVAEDPMAYVQMNNAMKNDVAKCTNITPVWNQDFIWGLDEEGHIERTGTFPGFQLKYSERDGTVSTLSLMVFPASEDTIGAYQYSYKIVSEDRSITGSSVGSLSPFESFCTHIKSFNWVEQQ